jgi:TRAP-type uncharacterized transport system fused permease subunit
MDKATSSPLPRVSCSKSFCVIASVSLLVLGVGSMLPLSAMAAWIFEQSFVIVTHLMAAIAVGGTLWLLVKSPRLAAVATITVCFLAAISVWHAFVNGAGELKPVISASAAICTIAGSVALSFCLSRNQQPVATLRRDAFFLWLCVTQAVPLIIGLGMFTNATLELRQERKIAAIQEFKSQPDWVHSNKKVITIDGEKFECRHDSGDVLCWWFR